MPFIGQLPAQTFMPTPLPLKIVLWADFLIFFFFALKNYFGPYKPEYDKLAANAIGRTGLWNSDMVNGCGGIICMWIFGGSLWEGAISVMDVEILFLSHALWYGQLVAMMPPTPAVQCVLLTNPHTWLYLGVIATGWQYARWPCYVASAVILIFGLYRRWYQVPRDVYKKPSITIHDTLDAIASYDAEGAQNFEGCMRAVVPCIPIPPRPPEPDAPPAANKGLLGLW